MSQESIRAIEQHLPAGHTLPAQFEALFSTELPASIEWNDFEHYALKPSASQEAVPFLRLSDGGLIAFWFCDGFTPIVHIGAHAELKVLATDFGRFLTAINQEETGLSEFDDAEPPLRLPTVTGRQPPHGDIASLQTDLELWFERHTSLQKPTVSAESETVRLQLFTISQTLIRDGYSKSYTLDSLWWFMYFQITVTTTGINVTYLDHGKWGDVPPQYKLRPLIVNLLAFVKHKDKAHYELSVDCSGRVSVNGDKELLLLSPDGVD
ncbi:MAG: hypothetical protein ACPG8W_23115 [Candidatus Promineifilaceae bacterium]